MDICDVSEDVSALVGVRALSPSHIRFRELFDISPEVHQITIDIGSDLSVTALLRQLPVFLGWDFARIASEQHTAVNYHLIGSLTRAVTYH